MPREWAGLRLGGLDRRMRGRWQTVSGLWEENKARANRLNLLGQLDYIHKLSSQLEWMEDPEEIARSGCVHQVR